MVSMVFLLLFAGYETTTHLISGSIYEMLKNPELRNWLEEDWKRLDLAVEEFLRLSRQYNLPSPGLCAGISSLTVFLLGRVTR